MKILTYLSIGIAVITNVRGIALDGLFHIGVPIFFHYPMVMKILDLNVNYKFSNKIIRETFEKLNMPADELLKLKDYEDEDMSILNDLKLGNRYSLINRMLNFCDNNNEIKSIFDKFWQDLQFITNNSFKYSKELRKKLIKGLKLVRTMIEKTADDAYLASKEIIEEQSMIENLFNGMLSCLPKSFDKFKPIAESRIFNLTEEIKNLKDKSNSSRTDEEIKIFEKEAEDLEKFLNLTKTYMSSIQKEKTELKEVSVKLAQNLNKLNDTLNLKRHWLAEASNLSKIGNLTESAERIFNETYIAVHEISMATCLISKVD